jgi:hypothetical protein
MPEELSSHFIDLIHDALLKSFWRKGALLNFLRRHKISDRVLSTWHESESKRMFLARILPKIEAHPQGVQVLQRMADSLANQTKFPDLEGWEDSESKIQAAKESVLALKRQVAAALQEATETAEREATRKVARAKAEKQIATRVTLQSLEGGLKQLSSRLGTQQAGYDFQDWFYDVVDFFETVNRRPYVTGGRQIDGSLTLEGTTYLTELKFTNEQAAATDIDTFLAKVNDKADNTMGIMVSMAGYSSVAIQQASGKRTPLILLDYSHIYLVLGGNWTLPEVISRVRRHVSQTAEAFLPASEFSK